MEHSIRCAAKLVSISLETDKHIIEKCQAQSGVCDRPAGKDLEDFAAAIIHSHDPLLTDRMISTSAGHYREERDPDCLKWGSNHI